MQLKDDLDVLLRELQRRTAQLRGLAQATLAVNSAKSFPEVIQVITDQARQVIGAHLAVTSFTTGLEWSQSIDGLSLSDKYAAYRDFREKPDGSGLYAVVCETNRPIRMTQQEMEAHARWRGYGRHAPNHPPLRGWLAAPLVDQRGGNLGLIQLSDRYEGEFTAEDEAILTQFAQMASSAIELHKARDELEARVNERTAELQCANEGLQAEVVERKHVEETLRASEERFRNVLENSRDAIYRLNLQTQNYDYVSPGSQQILGCSPEAVLAGGRALIRSRIHPDDRDRVRDYVARLCSLKQGEPFEPTVEYRFNASGPGYRWISDSPGVIFDRAGVPVAIVGAVRDVTERKEAEERLQAKERLLHRLLDIQERERKLIAYEIHDGFLQYVVGAKMMLEAAQHRMETGEPSPTAGLEAIEKLLGKAVAEGRRMVSDLRPLILDEQGIVEGIAYLVAEEHQRGKTAIAFTHEVSFDRLPTLLEGTLFRIVQEALSNLRRHSGAAKAEVKLFQTDDGVGLEIRDDGVGFDPQQIPETHFGVRGILERVRLFGGAAAIESEPGKGTRIAVTLPLRGPEPSSQG